MKARRIVESLLESDPKKVLRGLMTVNTLDDLYLVLGRKGYLRRQPWDRDAFMPDVLVKTLPDRGIVISVEPQNLLSGWRPLNERVYALLRQPNGDLTRAQGYKFYLPNAHFTGFLDELEQKLTTEAIDPRDVYLPAYAGYFL